jgi:cell division topological specificity factor
MFDFLKFLNKQPSSKDVAKERLRLVLIQDRGSNVDPKILEQLKNDIITVINKYLEVDEGALEIEFTKADAECESDGKNFSHALVANIPIKGVKRPND